MLAAMVSDQAEAAFTVTRQATQIDWTSGAVTCAIDSAATAGDLLIIGLAGDNNIASIAWASASELVDKRHAGNNSHLGVAYLVATGGETTVTFTPTSSLQEQLVCHVLRIAAGSWHGTTVPESTAGQDGIGETPDGGPELNPSGWGTEATLWIVFMSTTSEVTIDAYPTNYTTNGASTNCGTPGTCTMASSWREASAASENPGAWDLSLVAGNSVVAVVAVRPATAAASCAGRLALLGVGC